MNRRENQSSTLKIPAGEREGRLLRAEEVAPGLACGCHCPGCGARLVARNRGKHRRPHFAHHQAPESRACFETALHKLAKQVLLEARELLLPAFAKPPVHDLAGHAYPLEECHAEPRGWAYHTARKEVRLAELDGRTPDIVLYGPQPQRPLLVEVRVTHQVDDAKAQLVRERDMAMIEIDLSSLVESDLEPDRFSALVLAEPGNRKWIHCPHREGLYRSLLARTQPRIEAANARFARQQAAEAERLASQEGELDYARTASRPENRQRKLAMMARRDQPRIRALYERYFDEETWPPWLMEVDPDAWAFEVHPLLWQLALYAEFVAGQPAGTRIGIGTLVSRVCETFGCDERLYWLAVKRYNGHFVGEAWLPDPSSAVIALMNRMRDVGVVTGGRDGWYTVVGASWQPVRQNLS